MPKSYRFTICERDERGYYTIGRLEWFTSTPYHSTPAEIEAYNRDGLALFVTSYCPVEVGGETTNRWGDRRLMVGGTDERFRFVRWRDPDWQEREQGRLDDGTYDPLPWSDLEPIPGHYAHISVEAEAMVAFTPDANKGELDLQTRIKPGRYLTKFYPELAPDTVRELACVLDKATEVRFAETADDFETVYTNGPRSCMSHHADDFASPVHPCRVYAAGDLQLAYLSSVAIEHDAFKASARCLVWPERKLFGRIYGDEDRLAAALRNLGYQKGDLDGARLLKIEHRNTYVMPYIDGEQLVSDAGDYFKIDSDGTLSAGNTNGLLDRGRYCPIMDEYYDEDEVAFIYVQDRDEYVSFEAYERGHVWYCSYSDNYYEDSDDQVEVEGEVWHRSYAKRHCFYCEGSEEWVRRRDNSAVELEDTGETVSLSWAEDNAYCSDVDGLWYRDAENAPQATEDDEEDDTPGDTAIAA